MTSSSYRRAWFRVFVPVSFFCLSATLQAQQAGPAPGDAAARAVVQLLAIGPGANENNRECGGTGFLINSEGDILTNAHVIEEARRCLAGDARNKIMAKISVPTGSAAPAVSCDVIALDEIHDLAVIRPERPLPMPNAGGQWAFLTLDPSEAPEGTRVSVTGHPHFAWNPVTESGKVVRRSRLRLTETSAEQTEVLILDVALRPGNSGSPVYRSGGTGVVGIVERQERFQSEYTVAVPTRYAIDLLNRYRVAWSATSGSTPRDAVKPGGASAPSVPSAVQP